MSQVFKLVANTLSLEWLVKLYYDMWWFMRYQQLMQVEFSVLMETVSMRYFTMSNTVVRQL